MPSSALLQAPDLRTARYSPAIQRAVLLVLLFTAELGALTIWLDNADLQGRGAAAGFIFSWGAWVLKGAVGFFALFTALAWRKNRASLQKAFARRPSLPFHLPAFCAHAAAMAGFVALSRSIYSGHITESWPVVAIPLWLVLGLTGIVFASLAVLGAGFWRELLRGSGLLACYSLATVLLACFGGNALRALWAPLTRLTFMLVQAVLLPLLPNLISIPSTATIGTPTFSVEIAPQCSGLEGIGLLLAFVSAWLFLFRKEFRFPQALFILPAGIVFIFLFNSLRIAALVLIGNYGAPGIAAGGFHSQSGWMIFICVALAFPVLSQRIPWLSAKPEPATVRAVAEDSPEPFLVPFIVILATGMLARAFSSDFEWLYPARFVAALLALWSFRSHYAALRSKPTWAAPAAGVLIYLLWLLMSRSLSSSNAPMPPALAAAAPLARYSWIVFRVLAASLTVPLAEELAFRGFLLRRLLRPDFESVPFTAVSWTAVLVSSLAFGLLHGGFWLVGTLAGLLIAFVLRRHGRFADAVVAHATANALLAFNVLCFGQWQLW